MCKVGRIGRLIHTVLRLLCSFLCSFLPPPHLHEGNCVVATAVNTVLQATNNAFAYTQTLHTDFPDTRKKILQHTRKCRHQWDTLVSVSNAS